MRIGSSPLSPLVLTITLAKKLRSGAIAPDIRRLRRRMAGTGHLHAGDSARQGTRAFTRPPVFVTGQANPEIQIVFRSARRQCGLPTALGDSAREGGRARGGTADRGAKQSDKRREKRKLSLGLVLACFTGARSVRAYIISYPHFFPRISCPELGR